MKMLIKVYILFYAILTFLAWSGGMEFTRGIELLRYLTFNLGASGAFTFFFFVIKGYFND